MKYIKTSDKTELTGRQKWPSAFEHIKAKAHSGWETKWPQHLHCLKREDFFVVTGRYIDGDAPKDFIKVFDEHVKGKIKRRSRRKWTPYIAKAAYKSYPNESIVEHLMNRLGHALGLNMAESKLVWAKGQIRFLSRFFKKPHEEMVHGAQIYAKWLSDPVFVKAVEAQKAETDFFTFQEAERAIQGVFEPVAEVILTELVRLLVFDALVGNSDRHFYNWAVLLDTTGKKEPYFSPVYDTARGLFWNTAETILIEKSKSKDNFDTYLKNYSKKSKPRMGWNSSPDATHFIFFEKLYHEDGRFKHICDSFLNPAKIEKIEHVLENEFKLLFSPLRYQFILGCLRFRFQALIDITKKSQSS